MARVSVIIPTYNRKNFLLPALESVFAQTFEDYEVIVVDDGSTDQTKEAIQPFMGRIRYIFKQNGGVSSARNRGIQEAKGEIIAFLDSDDLWESRFLELTTDYLLQHPDLAMVSTAWRTHPSGHQWPPVKKQRLHGQLFGLLMGQRIVRTSAVVARKEILMRVGPFDECLEPAEDLDMWLRIARSYPTAFLNVPLSWGRKHASNVSKNRLLHIERQLQVLESHYNPALVSKKIYDRRRSELYVSLGRYHLKMRQVEEAKASLRKAVALNPYHFRARRYLLKAFFAAKNVSP